MGIETAAASIAHGGRPLAASVRTDFESRFGRDFSTVRVHDDTRAHAAAEAIEARAFTLGRHIAFGRGEYRPATGPGRRLLAHELAHTLQGGGAAGDARRVIRRRRVRTRAGRTFEVGGAKVVNRAARNDILQHGVLFPGSDQAHIMVTGRGELGYEVSHTDPEDPFRWSKFKEIVDGGAVDIKAVSLTDTVPTRIIRNGQSQRQDITLFSVGGSGITLVRESLLRRVSPNEPTVTASVDPDRDKIYYVARGAGGNPLSSNALAHELFGHYWLALQGVPFLHPPSVQELLRRARQRGRTPTRQEIRAAAGRHRRLGVLSARHGIEGPFGYEYTGTVREYIDRLVGASTGRVESPTRRVSDRHLRAELQALYRELLKPRGLVLRAGGRGVMSAAAARHWAFVANSYEVLRHIPTPQPGSWPSQGMLSEGVRDVIIEWYEDRFDEDQRRAFRNVLGAAGSPFLSGMPPNLARDVLDEIGRRARR